MRNDLSKEKIVTDCSLSFSFLLIFTFSSSIYIDTSLSAMLNQSIYKARNKNDLEQFRILKKG